MSTEADRSTRIWVIGASNIDIIAKSAERIVAADSNIGTIEKAAGGVGRNIAFALKALGFDVCLLTAISDDEDGRLIAEDLEKKGIRVCEKLCDSAEIRTGSYCCILDGDGSFVCAVNDMKINERLTPETVMKYKDSLEESDYVVFEANLPLETIKAISSLNVKLVADCVSAVKAAKLTDVLESLYLLKANFGEACAVAGLDGVEPDAEGIQTVMEALVAKGLRRAIISLGKNGAFFYEASGTGTRGMDVSVPENLDVVSTNGCGDVLLAAFLRAMSEGLPAEDALYYGQAASAVNAQSMEAVSPLLDFETVKKKAEEYYEQIS